MYMDLKKEATSCVKINKILNEINIPTGIYMKDVAFTTNSGIVNIHLTKGTYWVLFVDEFYFDSYGFPSPVNVITNQINRGIYSEN